jgi:xanthine dehydrogenase accessory factor
VSFLKEIKDIFLQLNAVWERGEKAAMLMITEVRGSSYRRPGTKMMISSDGQIFGTLSGGCLESDLAEWAKIAIEQNKPMTRSYNLSENDLWGLGIGCKGSLDVLILPIERESLFWNKLKEEVCKNQIITLVFDINSGEGWLLNDHNQVLAQNGENLSGDLLNDISSVGKQEKQFANVVNEGNNRFVIDTVFPLQRVVVSGAGHDAVPVVELAIKSNFDVIVLDPRTQFNQESRFPGANHIIAEPETIDALSHSLHDSFWIIMNHHMERDREALRLALQTNPKYVGLLGPIKRSNELLESIGSVYSDQMIYSPVGLDLGAETIEEVAISIISELLAVRNEKTSGHLKGKNKIHA